MHSSLTRRSLLLLIPIVFVISFAASSWAQAPQKTIVWSAQEKPIVDQLTNLPKLDDAARARSTKDLAMQIRKLPSVPNKLGLAGALSRLATEGDCGRETLQEVTTTLAMALREVPPAPKDTGPNHHYVELAQLVRYEHMKAESSDPQYEEAMNRLADADAARQNADFTLADVEGESWHLADLKGKVLLVNFWSTSCAPCRKEMPDLQALFDKYKERGLIVLSISNEASAKVEPVIAEQNITYPMLLDPKSKIHELFQIGSLPRSFVYNRDGTIVAQSINMRTKGQFQEMLAAAGLK
jgi:peroxiredoxin